MVTCSETWKEEQNTRGSVAVGLGKIYVNEYLGMTPNVRIFVSFENAHQTAFAVEDALHSQVDKITHFVTQASFPKHFSTCTIGSWKD